MYPSIECWVSDDLSPLYQSPVVKVLNVNTDARGAFYVSVYARALWLDIVVCLKTVSAPNSSLKTSL